MFMTFTESLMNNRDYYFSRSPLMVASLWSFEDLLPPCHYEEFELEATSSSYYISNFDMENTTFAHTYIIFDSRLFSII